MKNFIGYYFTIRYEDINLIKDTFYKSENFNDLENCLLKAKSKLWEFVGYNKNVFDSLNIVKRQGKNVFVTLFDFDKETLKIFLKEDDGEIRSIFNTKRVRQYDIFKK